MGIEFEEGIFGGEPSTNPQFEFRNPQLILVDLARFERATSTFAESRSDSAELQVRDLPAVSELR